MAPPSPISGAQYCSLTPQCLGLALAGWMGPRKIACWALRIWEGGQRNQIENLGAAQVEAGEKRERQAQTLSRVGICEIKEHAG